MEGLLTKVNQYNKIRQQIIDEKLSDKEPHDVPPEMFFSEEHKKVLASQIPWVGPDGDESEGAERTTSSGRSKNKIFPDMPFGMLIGAVKPRNKNELPNKDNSFIFPIGQENDIDNKDIDGELWLSVNDALIPDFQELQDFFYIDNLGFFVVKVTIQK